MTVYDFCYLCTDDSEEILIWDICSEQQVFSGSMREAMYSKYADAEVCSFDILHNADMSIASIELNIEWEDDEYEDSEEVL